MSNKIKKSLHFLNLIKFKNFRTLKFIIFKQFGLKKKHVKLNLKIFSELICDSLDFLEFKIILEKIFEFEISDNFNIQNKTVKEILNYVTNKKIKNGV
jgi:acyl carrier protein